MLQEQSKELWKIRDVLQKEVSNDALRGLLEFNGQELAAGESRVRGGVLGSIVWSVTESIHKCGRTSLCESGEWRVVIITCGNCRGQRSILLLLLLLDYVMV